MKTLLPHTTSDFSVEDEHKAQLIEATWVKHQTAHPFKTKYTPEEWKMLQNDPRYQEEQRQFVVTLKKKMEEFSKTHRSHLRGAGWIPPRRNWPVFR
jgi:hypothetical protein